MIPTLLLTLLVKSGLIAGAGLLASRIGGLRPTDRVDILRATTVLLLALPVVMALAPSLDLAVLPANEAAPEPLPMWSGEVVSMGGVAVSGSMPWPSASMLLLAAWAVGVAALALRLALGLHMLSRWTETGTPIDNPGWSRPLQRLAPRHAPRLISTDRIDGPLSWGTTPGVILIDRASLSAPETAPAVIAHELGHLKRRDWVFLILSRLAVALFWFNPLVWRLRSELSARSEETADAEALRTIDRQTYARTLVRLAAHPSPLVATAMAADARSLKKRIACIMSDLPPSRRRPLTVALTLAGLAAVATPLAALELHNRTAPAAAPAVASAASPALAATLAVAPAAPQTVSRSQTVIRTDGVTYISVPDAEPLPASSSNVIYLRAADMPEAPVPPAPPAPPPPPAFVHAFAPPAPPAPPSFAVPPAPPAPPPPPAPYSASYQGGYHVLSSRPATPEERRMADTARAEADVARRQATEARRVAADVRRDAERVRLDAGREQARADQARVHAEAARTGADRARAAADVARQQAARQMAEGRVQMGRGAEEMHRGADQMRRESVKLRDPAYRAEQIARSRAQGRTVTDKELCDLSPRLATQAAELDRRADELAARARATQ